ncbi:MAG: tRNA-dihydrouridine synthase [Fibrobacter sp.]|nr:tRNA-dihydrouridine synthase [Fibrobacter sp.]
MDGVTDAPFRRLCRVLSGNRMGLLVSEFVPTNADEVFSLTGHKQLKFYPEEKPFGIQIFGCYPDKMAAAAKKIADGLHPDYIEVNAGCPAPKVAGKGSGSGLLRDLPRLQEILHDVRAALDTCEVNIPLTLKCRIGWDDESINVMETLKIAEGEGVELLVVHGRTRLQGYNGLANWDWIGKVASAAKIPVVGNGDVNSVECALERINTYGVAGVSIGRGAMHNPWIFGQIADAWEGKPAHIITAEEALDVFSIYYKFLDEEGRTEMGAMGRLKQLGARLCKGFVEDEAPGSRLEVRESSAGYLIPGNKVCVSNGSDAAAMHVRQTLLTAQTPEEFFERKEMLKSSIAKSLRYDPTRLVNLNGAKDNTLVFGNRYENR